MVEKISQIREIFSTVLFFCTKVEMSLTVFSTGCVIGYKHRQMSRKSRRKKKKKKEGQTG